MIGRLGRGLMFAGTAASLGWLGMTLSTANAEERRLVTPFPSGGRLAEREPDRVDSARVRKLLQAALAASDPGTREMGALALGFNGDPRSIPPLIARLRDDTPRVRATVAWALGEVESKEAVRPLIEALRDADALVRESAAHALG